MQHSVQDLAGAQGVLMPPSLQDLRSSWIWKGLIIHRSPSESDGSYYFQPFLLAGLHKPPEVGCHSRSGHSSFL